ncbi:MAG: NERD domain-containing protein, partial [Bacteroidia bacterium]
MRLKLLLLILLTGSQVVIAKDFYLAMSDLNVRTGAGKVYSVSFTLNTGDEVEFISKENNWIKIKYQEQIGYCSSKYLKFNRTIDDLTTDALTEDYGMDSFILVLAILIIIIVLYVYLNNIDNKLLQSITDKNRGTKSERDLILKLLKIGVIKQYIFHDLYLEKRKSQFSQTDLVAVTSVGIFVFEVKDYSGWIYGTGNQSQWTKVLTYGRQK